MAKSALANKYRPREFNEVVEQKFVTTMLEALCASKQLTNRNFLFIGSAGVGKTTTARIVADKLNDGQGEPIEIDAASNNGVENMRELIQQARMYPVGCKYKVYIVDECFPANAWVSTPSGKMLIKDIQPGDRVYNMTGQAAVTRVLHNTVKTDNLISVRLNDRSIVTTADHLFFTDDGWVAAKDLHEGDVLYDNASLQAMRQAIHCEVQERREGAVQPGVSESIHDSNYVRQIYHRISQNVSDMWQKVLHSCEHKCYNMFSEVFRSMEEAESQHGEIVGATCKTLALIYLSSLWQKDRDPEQRSSNCMFPEVCNGATVNDLETDSNQAVCMVRKYIYSQLREAESANVFERMPICADCRSATRSAQPESISTNEIEQSNVRSDCGSQNGIDQAAKWHLTSSACIAWWQRNIHETAADAERDARRFVDIRISCSNRCTQDKSGTVSYELQTRPRLSRTTAGDRGGWCRPSYEIASVVRREKSKVSSGLRVASVTRYQRGHNDELFRSSFSDSELHSDYVTMYDLEIAGHPSYFVSDILVHNCQALSAAAWASLLKPLEEGIGRAVWMFCTTNPEKIPGTILSRVQTFRLSKISTEGITNRLKYIVDSEISEGAPIEYTDDALAFIAKIANGGMRDAITLLDQAITYNPKVTSQTLVESLNLPNYSDFFDLLSAYAKRDDKATIEIVDRIYNSGVNFVKWFENFHSFVMNIVKFIFTQDIGCTVIPSHFADKMTKYTSAHAAVCLTLANKLIKMNKDLKSSQYLQEVALTYLCFGPKRKE